MPFYNEAAEIGYNHTIAHLNMKKKCFYNSLIFPPFLVTFTLIK